MDDEKWAVLLENSLTRKEEQKVLIIIRLYKKILITIMEMTREVSKKRNCTKLH